MSGSDQSQSRMLSGLAWIGYLFLILPSLIVIPMSFGNKDEFQFPPKMLSIYLYRRYLSDPAWMDATVQSLTVAGGAMIVALLLGISTGYGLTRQDFRGKQLIIVLLLGPVFVPAVVIALGLFLYFGLLGLVNTTTGLILAHALITFPFATITILSGLRQVDPVLERAAYVMGASQWRTLVRVTLPLIRPSIITSAIFAFLISFDEVVVAYFLTGFRTQTLPVKMYSSIHFEISPVLAAIASILSLLSFAVCVGSALVQGDRER